LPKIVLGEFKWKPLAGLVLVLAGCGVSTGPTSVEPSKPPAVDPAVVDPLVRLIHQRLLLMHDVARWKWNAGSPVHDPQRERAIVAELSEFARTLRIDPDFAAGFMRAQIEAGKRMQEADFARWTAAGQGHFAEVPDLPSVTRPRIDAVSRQLLTELARLDSQLRTPALRQALVQRSASILIGEGIDEHVRAAALAPLLLY
jgi:chorismate mutase